jgi:hypothetical protein
MSTQRYDRASIMRRAHQLRRLPGLDMSVALRLSWAEAKTGNSATQGAQEAGLKAALRRYGLDRLAARAKAFVAHLQAELRGGAMHLPPHAGAPELEARRDSDGTFWA